MAESGELQKGRIIQEANEKTQECFTNGSSGSEFVEIH